MTKGRTASTPPESLADPKFWTVGETAVLLRVSRMTVYRLVHAGILKSKRIGRSFRIPEEAIVEYLGGEEDST